MSRGKIDALRRIGRRQFAQMCAGSLALAAAGCSRGRQQRDSKIMLLHPGDERLVFEPRYDYGATQLVFLPLVSLTDQGDLYGRLAESWEHSRDYATWTIRLRPHVRWHDGRPVTADDIKFTIDLWQHPDVLHIPPGSCSVRVLDERTCTVTFHRRIPIRNPVGYLNVYYPKHLLEKLDPKKIHAWEFWTWPIGNGPYRYVRHVPKTMTELEANPDYYGGKPRIERVVLKFGQFSSMREQRLVELLSGNVDAIAMLTPSDALPVAGDARFRVYHAIAPFHLKAILWNQRHLLFREPQIRLALTLAIDRRELQRLLNLPASAPVFDVIYADTQLLHGELPPPLPHDPERAKQLLDAAGWRSDGGDGLRRRNGTPFRFTALATLVEGLLESAVFVQDQLRRVGIRMDIETLDVLAGRAQVRHRSFEAAVIRIQNTFGPFGLVELFGRDSALGYANPKVRALLDEAQFTVDEARFDQIFRELWPIFQAELPATFLYPSVWTTVANRRVHGLSSSRAHANPGLCMFDLWLEDER